MSQEERIKPMPKEHGRQEDTKFARTKNMKRVPRRLLARQQLLSGVSLECVEKFSFYLMR